MTLDGIILTILGCLFLGLIVSLIIFVIIGSRNYEKNFNKCLLISTIVIGIVLFGLDFMYQAKLYEYKDKIYNANSLNELLYTIEENEDSTE